MPVRDLQLVSTDDLDHTIIMLVDGVRYEYWLKGYYPGVEIALKGLIRRRQFGKALEFLKAWSKDVVRLDQRIKARLG